MAIKNMTLEEKWTQEDVDKMKDVPTESESEKCQKCHKNFEVNDMVKTLPGGEKFHSTCFDDELERFCDSFPELLREKNE